jgi:hypothetical protein
MFDGEVRYMFIHTGKDNLPQSSYANGWLFTETEDEVDAEWNATGHRPDPIGDIYFRCGVLLGEEIKPHITVRRSDGTFEWQNYQPQRSTSKTEAKEGCFIATAVYGSADVHQVTTFRKFRNDVLSSSVVGRLVIRIYARFSPSVAVRISRRRKLRAFIRYVMLNPTYYLITRFFLKSPSDHGYSKTHRQTYP